MTRRVRLGKELAFLVLFSGWVAFMPNVELLRWSVFFLSAYAVMSNDSLQTIGTFMSSNGHRPWWLLWLFTSGVFFVTVAYSWHVHGGDVTFQRLHSKEFLNTPNELSFFQCMAPVLLLVLTRFRVPISTTFLLLSIFSKNLLGVERMFWKSIAGYLVSFGVAAAVWFAVSRLLRSTHSQRSRDYWVVLQWVSSALLWGAGLCKTRQT